LLRTVFPEVGKNIGIENIFLAGQSYGGSTVLETMANLRIANKVSPLIKGLICMDAWYFPLSSTTYENLKDENILFLNSESFFKIVPYIYYME
jgi:pimeloyl-ACP methyl ester carboxylesterase